jgi:hypothetical protein
MNAMTSTAGTMVMAPARSASHGSDSHTDSPSQTAAAPCANRNLAVTDR